MSDRKRSVIKRSWSEDEDDQLAPRGAGGGVEMSSPAKQPRLDVRRHDEFYFDDHSIILKVENTLFGVHRSKLAKSSGFFKSMFTLPPGSQADAEGGSDANPIVIQGDKAEDFAALMWACYAEYQELESASLDKLSAVLHCATKYDFPSQRSYAIARLDSKLQDTSLYPDPTRKRERALNVQRLVLARQFDIPAWVRPAIESLVSCAVEGFTDEEADMLGAQTVLNLAQAREGALRRLFEFLQTPPAIHHGCTKPDVCQRNFCNAWESTIHSFVIAVARGIHSPFKAWELLDQMATVQEFGKIRTPCKASFRHFIQSAGKLEETLLASRFKFNT